MTTVASVAVAPPDASWHALRAEEVRSRLHVPDEGLDDGEAAVRRARWGPNTLRPAPPASAWSVLVAQLRGVVVLLLVAALLVALARGDLLDTAAIAVVLVVNVAIGFVTELRAHRAVEALSRLEVPTAVVRRAGRVRQIAAAELVPGDVILLEAGSIVPADARLVAAHDLSTSEAPLTGESVPVSKDPAAVLPPQLPLGDRTTMVYKATAVATGSGRAVVVATGMHTEVGKIGTLVSSVRPGRTLLERRLDRLGRRLAAVSLLFGAVIGLLLYLRDAALSEVLGAALAMAVAAVPEGLPAVVTITMALGTRRMARRGALVRRLPSVETLGSTTIVCTDKTGTLTSGEQTVTRIWVAGREIEIEGSGFEPSGRLLERGAPVIVDGDPPLRELLEIAALANDGRLEVEDGRWVARGDPTDAALLVVAAKGSIDREALLRRSPRREELPFSSERMLMASYHPAAAGRIAALLKGAPARVLARCTRVRTADGSAPLDGATRRSLEEVVDSLAARGLRVLALARGEVGAMHESELRELELVGFVGLTDPPAAGVHEAIVALGQAGVRTVMLTGDHRATASAIAASLGLGREGAVARDASDVDVASDEEVRRWVEHVDVWSRISAAAKLRIVAALQHRGEVVAMLGDGVNDAAALRKADVGIAMGQRGTDVAKDAADIVLEDDRFSTVVAAVEEGRVVFDNIRKFVFYLFSCNLAEVLSVLIAGVSGLPLPVTALQILWLNIVTDTIPALALAIEPAEEDVMRRPPRDPRSEILSPASLRAAAAFAVLLTAVTLAALLIGLREPGRDESYAVTMSFTTLALAQLFHLGNARRRGAVLAGRAVVANRAALAAVAITVALQVVAVQWSGLARPLDARALALRDWMLVVALAAAPAIVGQLVKLLRRHGRA